MPLDQETSRHFEGAGLGTGPWKCPACGVEQTSDPNDGCPGCGSGTAKAYHVGVQAAPTGNDRQPSASIDAGWERTVAASASLAAARWAEQHPGAPLAEAFVAGFQLAQGLTMPAPPVSVDVDRLAPDGKATRTIIAALRLFKDQALREASIEIVSGEWCSPDEVDDLIQFLEARA